MYPFDLPCEVLLAEVRAERDTYRTKAQQLMAIVEELERERAALYARIEWLERCRSTRIFPMEDV